VHGASLITIICVLVAGCASLRPTETLRATGPETQMANRFGTQDDRSKLGLIQLFVTDYNESKEDATNVAKAQAFLSSGLQLVKSNCDDFFHGIGRARQDANFAQRSIALGGAAAGTIAGITGASAKSLALLAAGVGLTLGFSEIYADEYLFAPDIAAVQQLIHTAQSEYIKQIEDQGLEASLNFYTAHGLIQEFQGYCEVQTIKSLVNAAIKAGKFSAVSSDNEARVRGQATTDSLALVSGVAGRTLSSDEIAFLYWEYVLGSSDADQANRATIAALVKELNVNGTKTQQFRLAFAALTADARKTIESTIAAMKKRAAAASPAPSLTGPAPPAHPSQSRATRGGALPARIILQVK
jgi:hypothetical protein